MAESTADATAANADTLRLELEKTMTEIVDEGGALKEIDKAIRILNRLRVVESKKAEPNIPSPSGKVQVPKEFKCPLSYAIMSEPVVIASGQTFEKRYIRKWLENHQTCPKTKQVLPYRIYLTPNHLIDGLITQWCRDNEYDRPNPSENIAIGMMSDDIDSLLHRISSPSSVEDQKKAAKELCRQIQLFENVRAFFFAEMPESITRLLSPVSALGNAVGSNPELQEYISTALLYILGFAEDMTLVAQIPHVIQVLTMSLKQGTAGIRYNSAVVFATLSRFDSCKIVIGNSLTLKALIDAFEYGNYSAGLAVFNLCLRSVNWEMAVSEGLIPVLADKLKARSHVKLTLNVLSVMFKHNGVIEEMEDLGFIDDLLSILRNTGCSETAEKAVEIVFGLCCLDTGDRNRESTRREVVEQEEKKYQTFSKLAKQGSGGPVTIAKEICKWLKSGTRMG